ncbi:MAG: hypothetical protein IPO02_01385 [Bacteroidetes bacterium]|nr:hypothetical protein [Bacteroidota bacterium]
MENQELNITGDGFSANMPMGKLDRWFACAGAKTPILYILLVTKDTVLLDTIQTFQTPIFGYYGIAGQSSFNSDGSKYAFASGRYLSDGAHLFIADFDRCYEY